MRPGISSTLASPFKISVQELAKNSMVTRGLALEYHTVDSSEQRIFILESLFLQKVVDFHGCQSALQLLSVQLLLLYLLNRQLAFDTVLGASEVTASAAGGDQVGNTGGFNCEGLSVDRVFEKGSAELHHLQQTDSHDSCFGIVSPTETVDVSSSESDYVLQCTTEGDTGNIMDDSDMEVRPVEEGLQQRMVYRWEVRRHGA